MHPDKRARTGIESWLGLLAWLALTFVAAGLGALASSNAAGFYQQLLRPSWAPPGWLFAPVWSVLYLMMGVAAWLVWRAHGLRCARRALGLFVAQLAANALWTWLFFAWRQGGIALAEVVLLWLLIVATTVSYRQLGERLAAALMLPYLAWVTLATALTWASWRLNPGLL